MKRWSKEIALIVAVVILSLDATRAFSQQTPGCKLPDSTTTQMASTQRQDNFGDISLHLCVNKRQSRVIECQFFARKETAGLIKFDAASTALGPTFIGPCCGMPLPGPNDTWRFHTRLIDNFGEEHKVISAYFINGRCNPVNSLALGQGDSTWFKISFAGAADDINRARITMPDYSSSNNYMIRGRPLEFSGPVLRESE